ncbi:MAG: exonuclease SbcCD subunit D [Flammeovirgaceae bacterium]
MKILHTGDWHLGKKLGEYSRIEEQKAVLDEICKIADEENVDAILIAGDLYDNFNPASDAIELFYKTLHKLSNEGQRIVVAIAGNHDSPERIEAPTPLANECGIVLLGFPLTIPKSFILKSGLRISKTDRGFLEVYLPKYIYPLRILLTPYANEVRLKEYFETKNSDDAMNQCLKNHWDTLANQYCDANGVNILMTHLYMMERNGTQEKEPEDERSIVYLGGASPVMTDIIPNQIQYTAVGHLHRQHFVKGHQSPVMYSGSLLEYSFSETNQQKYVLIIEAVPQKPVDVTPVPLQSGKKLKRVRFKAANEALYWLENNQNCFVELTFATEKYIESNIKQSFFQAHQGIVHLIPEILSEVSYNSTNVQIDTTKQIEELFIEYFIKMNGNQPNKELLDLFKEIMNVE